MKIFKVLILTVIFILAMSVVSAFAAGNELLPNEEDISIGSQNLENTDIVQETASKKGDSQEKEHMKMKDKCKHHMHMKFMEALDKAVKAGTINENQKKEIMKYLHESMKELK